MMDEWLADASVDEIHDFLWAFAEIDTSHMRDRDELLAMIAECKAHRTDHVVFYCYSRFARNLSDRMAVLTTIRKTGITASAVTQPVQSEDPTGEFLEQILGAVNQLDKD